MLRLINVCKSYRFGKDRDVVLDNVNVDFKKRELVFILGRSGSGKSTLLNIIGGLLDVDSGKVMLDDREITNFDNKMLCNYRNNMVGFIFQDYHLIEYMSVIDNIRLGQTIKKDSSDIEDILRKLGIYSKRRTLVNKLSGGEKQRVAIARAIINNPDIILCDEPTGALDSVNSVRIMKILKDLSKDKLVIVVSHDEELANKYADRVVRINDGKIDYELVEDNERFREICKKRISLFSIIRLSIKNLFLKKGRTLFTSLAISIGFICMVMVLCLSRSFSDDIDKLERDIVSSYPIIVYNGEFEINDVDDGDKLDKFGSEIVRWNRDEFVHTNKIDSNYIDYVNDIDEISYINYEYDISMPFVSDRYKYIDDGYMKNIGNGDFVDDNYDLLYGDFSDDIDGVMLVVDSNNRVDSGLLDMFNIDKDVMYKDLVGRKIRVILNDLYYVKNGDYYYVDSNLEKLYNNSDLELEIVGIIREKDVVNDESFIVYSDGLVDYVIDKNSKSKIVLEQVDRDYNVLGNGMDKNEILSYLGYESMPVGINIYVDNMDDKDIVVSKLDEYNNKNRDNEMVYVDTMKDAIDIVKNIINVITIILVVFSLISIFVSSMMIFILTNNRVMERIKEIGILRGLGARKKDISKLFNIENLIIGILSCFIGIFIVNFLVTPVNDVMEMLLDDGGLFKIYNEILLLCVVFNIFIVVMSGYIPSIVAGNKKIVDCINNR